MVIEGSIETRTKMRANTYIRMFSLTMLSLISAFINYIYISCSELRVHTIFKETLGNLFRFTLEYTVALCIANIVYHIVKNDVKNRRLS